MWQSLKIFLLLEHTTKLSISLTNTRWNPIFPQQTHRCGDAGVGNWEQWADLRGDAWGSQIQTGDTVVPMEWASFAALSWNILKPCRLYLWEICLFFFFLAVRYRRLGISSNSVSPASAFPIFLITFYRKVTVENSLFVSIFFQTNTAVISHVINSFEGPCLTI